MLKAALEALVGVEHLSDVRMVASDNDHERLVPRVGHRRHQSGARLLAKLALAQLVRFVDEENATLGLVELFLHLLLGLPRVLASQVEARCLDHMATADEAEVVQDIGCYPRNCGLARTWGANKHEVPNCRSFLTIRFSDTQRRLQLLQLFLDPIHTIKLVKSGKWIGNRCLTSVKLHSSTAQPDCHEAIHRKTDVLLRERFLRVINTAFH
mmetsp:Transcript_5027/g.10364  ORF Transcript_5027/g.10364 Transcript_5027/m.10364 type:complete len:211 (+) Transcript_5027:1505-2137(+)